MYPKTGEYRVPRIRHMRSVISAWLLPVLVAAVAAAAVAAVPASAEDNYSCTNCATITGTNESIKYNEGVDYTQTQVCVTIWKTNGGTTYSTVGHRCELGFYIATVCSEVGTVTGHGEVYTTESGEHMAGHQDNKHC
jgi:hypothetical protein